MPQVFKAHIKGYDECALKDATEVMKTVTDTVVKATKTLETKISDTRAADSAIFAKYTSKYT